MIQPVNVEALRYSGANLATVRSDYRLWPKSDFLFLFSFFLPKCVTDLTSFWAEWRQKSDLGHVQFDAVLDTHPTWHHAPAARADDRNSCAFFNATLGCSVQIAILITLTLTPPSRPDPQQLMKLQLTSTANNLGPCPKRLTCGYYWVSVLYKLYTTCILSKQVRCFGTRSRSMLAPPFCLFP